jgi:hypothetical protein
MKFTEWFDNYQMAATFAQANEHQTALEVLNRGARKALRQRSEARTERPRPRPRLQARSDND